MIKIGGREIGGENPAFIIAELSANHNQNFETAVKTVHAAREAGADAIKLQTYTADTITLDCDNEYFQIKQGTIWDGTTLYKLYRQAYTPWEWQPKLKEIAESIGLFCFSSPFDKTAVDFLEEMNVPAYKVASFEITDIPLIKYIASKKKPVIISTGIAYEKEIEQAVAACREMGNDQVILLKCTSEYPAPFEEMNLNAIPFMKERFGTIAGLSDHSMGISVPVAAVALGAKVIEKHLIIDRSIGGPDSSFSLEPAEFKLMVNSVREVEKALGGKTFNVSERVSKSRNFARSLFAVKDIKEGEIFTEENVRSIRPGFGLPPIYLEKLLGKKSKRNIKRGFPLEIPDLNDEQA